MDWLPNGEKKSKFIRFGATHVRDRRTDRRTPHDGNSRANMHSIARQKNRLINVILAMAENKQVNNIRSFFKFILVNRNYTILI